MNPGAERSSQTVNARAIASLAAGSRLRAGYLRSVMRREWQLALLALCGLAPGVAVLTAWLNLALQLRTVGVSASSHAGAGCCRASCWSGWGWAGSWSGPGW